MLQYEELLTRISKSGPCYRWTISCLIGVLSVKMAYDIFLLSLTTASVPFHCAQAIVDNETLSLADVVANYSFAGNFSALNFTCTKPRFRFDADGLLHALTQATDNNGSSGEADKCTAWTFLPDPPERRTMFTEYEMVCDRQYLMDRMMTYVTLGTFLSTLCGPLGDIIGRKPFLILFSYVNLACNIAIVFVKDLTIQMVLRFIMGFGAQAVCIGLILITELVAEDYRSVHGNLIWIMYVIGYSSSAALGYYILDWRIQNVASVVINGVVFAAYVPLLTESPRWLLMKRKTDKARRTLKEICKYSGCKDVLENFNVEDNEVIDAFRQTDERRSCIFEFLPRENICRINYIVTLGVVTFNLFTVALVYFALSFERGFITADPYLNVLISGLLELPAYIVAWQMSHRIGRKYTTLSTMGFCGVGLIILPYIPTNPSMAFQASSAVAIAVKFSTTIAYSVVIVYAAEVLPTNVRSCSFFFACFLMGAGGLLAPEMGGALSAVYRQLPHLIYGAMSLLASLSVLLLPETKDRPMPNTLAEMEPVGCPGCTALSSRAHSSGEQNRRELLSTEDANGGGVDELKPLKA